MRVTTYIVNEQGLNEIRAFLDANHKNDFFTREMLIAWAEEAEFQLSEGNPATIEIRAWDSINGRTQQFTISDAGIDSETVETDD
jgi:hypothetical protein